MENKPCNECKPLGFDYTHENVAKRFLEPKNKAFEAIRHEFERVNPGADTMWIENAKLVTNMMQRHWVPLLAESTDLDMDLAEVLNEYLLPFIATEEEASSLYELDMLGYPFALVSKLFYKKTFTPDMLDNYVKNQLVKNYIQRELGGKVDLNQIVFSRSSLFAFDIYVDGVKDGLFYYDLIDNTID